MSNKLTFLAGERALKTIRDNGLSPEMIGTIGGAAGGPKWIVLNHLDRLIFSSWLNGRKDPLFLVGTSIASFRYAAVMQKNPVAAIETFLDAYINQCYLSKPTPAEVTGKSLEIMQTYLGADGIQDVLNHPYLRLNVLVAQCLGATANDNRGILTAGLAGASVANFISRKNLKFFFRRVLFHDPRTRPPFYKMNDFPTRRIPITPSNINNVILASGSIPLVMSRIRGIHGTGGGVFMDGGIVDYHLDLPYNSNDKIVLFPHYTDRIVPGWLDKHLSWRKPSKKNMENLLLVAPSREFIKNLPYGKIPDRGDFKTFFQKDGERISYWKKVASESRKLADDFHEAVETGTIRNRVKPLN